MTPEHAGNPEEAARAAASGEPEATEYEKPVVHDRRRIDPETGKARRPAEAPTAEPAESAGSAAEEPVGEEPAPDGALAQAKAEAATAAEELARRNADLYNLQQEYNSYVRRSKVEAAGHRQAGVVEVAEALLGVLDEIELARQHGDLSGPFQSIAEKLETALGQRFGVERFGAVGEEFDPNVHEALMNTPDAEATSTTVNRVLQPGYRVGERVLRAARVATTSPE